MVGRYTSGGQIYYTAYTSPDGSTWTAIPGSTQVISMTGPLLAGLAITSHNQGTASAVTLDTVSVKATELPPPGRLPERVDVRGHRHRDYPAPGARPSPAAPGT